MKHIYSLIKAMRESSEDLLIGFEKFKTDRSFESIKMLKKSYIKLIDSFKRLIKIFESLLNKFQKYEEFQIYEEDLGKEILRLIGMKRQNIRRLEKIFDQVIFGFDKKVFKTYIINYPNFRRRRFPINAIITLKEEFSLGNDEDLEKIIAEGKIPIENIKSTEEMVKDFIKEYCKFEEF
ncbi:MAG: hypothetical protein HWN67_03665 [Candidatus Helarchaeota archaeon]|nr:hypothetical protein [Candidatus Helarchaeota archaeon]